MSETQARREWTKENTTFVGLKLNNHTDKDILEALEGKPKQTEIKRLIRKGLAESRPEETSTKGMTKRQRELYERLKAHQSE